MDHRDRYGRGQLDDVRRLLGSPVRLLRARLEVVLQRELNELERRCDRLVQNVQVLTELSPRKAAVPCGYRRAEKFTPSSPF